MTLDPPLRRLITGWAAGAAVVVVVAGAAVGLQGLAVRPGPALAATALVALSTSLHANLELASRRLAMNLSGAGLVAAFTLVEPAVTVLAAFVGWVVLDLVRRVPTPMLVFNVSGPTVGAGLAAVVVEVTGGGPVGVDTIGGLLVLLAALLAYGVVVTGAASSLVARIDASAYREVVPALAAATAITTALSGSLGVLAVLLARQAPHVLPVLAIVLSVILFTLRDRMERIEYENEEHDRLERVVAGARDGIALLDGTGRIELANPAFRRVLRLDAEQELLGDSLVRLLARRRVLRAPASEDDPGPDSLAAGFGLLAADDPHLRLDLDLEERTVALLLTGTFDRFGRRVGTVVLAIDVTEERERESLREELLARVSHELRTPLTAIVGFVETLEARGPDLSESEQAQLLRIVGQQAGRLQRLVEDLLWTSRIARGRATAQPAAVHLDVALPSVVEALGPELSSTVQVSVPPGATAWVDPDHLQQILANLLRNADTYGHPPVQLTARARGDRVEIAVLDHGDGVPGAFVDTLFDTFAQASVGNRRTSHGLGLGLSIVRSLCEANDGTVRYRREAGVSRFEVELPRSAAEGP